MTYDSQGRITSYKSDIFYIQYTYNHNGYTAHYFADGFDWIEDHDLHGRLIHFENSNGFEFWKDYDMTTNTMSYRNSTGYKYTKDLSKS